MTGDPTDDGDPRDDLTASTEGDDLVRRVMGTPRKAAPLGVLPETVVDGTYRVIRRLGAGGMGVVHLAHDPQLKRDVALKLHAAGSGERLAREATAIAQLVHPNVVTVFQIGRHDGAVYVAMEYVDGGTARTWLAEGKRTWREILDVYLAAARGLGAAHQAGMVHRDFKPDNVLIGKDGRVRVADFGLARDAGERDAAGTLSSAELLTPLTATGAVMGTPAYMAPEQYQGRPVGAAADQFALCASLWEALYGARPFAGDSAAEVATAAASGRFKLPADERGVPRHLRRVLERGLSAEPAARFPSMNALIVALAPRRSRALVLGLGAVVLAGAGAAAVVAWPRAAIDPCKDAGRASIDRELPAALIDTMRASVAATPGAIDAPSLDARLAQARPALLDASRQVCRAVKVEHAMPVPLLDRSALCLAVRARATAILVGDAKLAADDLAIYRNRLRALPPLWPCTDVVALTIAPAQLDDDAIKARALLWASMAALEGGEPLRPAMYRYHAERVMSDDDAGAKAMALMLRGRIAYHAANYDKALQDLTDAYYAGQELDDPSVYLPALADLLQITTNERLDLEAAKPWIRTAKAALQRDLSRAPFESTGLLGVLVAVADRFGDVTAGLKYSEQFLEVTARLGDPDGIADAQLSRAHALAAAGQYPEAIAQYRAAIDGFEATVGPSNVLTFSAISSLGLVLVETGDLEAIETLTARLETILAGYTTVFPARANALLNLGVMFAEGAHDAGHAEKAYREARALFAELQGEDNPDTLLCDGNLAIIANDRGDHAEAVTILTRVLAVQERTLGADSPDVAPTIFNLAAAYLDGGDPARAVPLFARAAARFEALEPGQRRHVYALTQQARALTESGQARAALPLARQAEAFAAALPDLRELSPNASVEIARAQLASRAQLDDARRRLAAARARYLEWEMADRVRGVEALEAKLTAK